MLPDSSGSSARPEYRRSLRSGLSRIRLTALHMSGSLHAARQNVAHTQGTVVLTLHRIIPDNRLHDCRSPRGMVLRASAFCKLLRYLTQHADVLSPRRILDCRRQSEKPQVLLTFDDGWADNALVAGPLLASFGLQACFFVVTAYAGCAQPFWPERILWLHKLTQQAGRLDIWDWFLASLRSKCLTGSVLPATTSGEEKILTWLKQFSPGEIHAYASQALARLDPCLHSTTRDPYERLMSWEEMRALSDQGHIFASHTCTHALLSRINVTARNEELTQSRLDLSRHLRRNSIASDWVSYPNGDVNCSVQASARNAGYRFGFTTAPGLWDTKQQSLAIPRVNIWDGSLLSSNGTFNENQLEYSLFWRPRRAHCA